MLYGDGTTHTHSARASNAPSRRSASGCWSEASWREGGCAARAEARGESEASGSRHLEAPAWRAQSSTASAGLVGLRSLSGSERTAGRAARSLLGPIEPSASPGRGRGKVGPFSRHARARHSHRPTGESSPRSAGVSLSGPLPRAGLAIANRGATRSGVRFAQSSASLTARRCACGPAVVCSVFRRLCYGAVAIAAWGISPSGLPRHLALEGRVETPWLDRPRGGAEVARRSEKKSG